jgi:Bacterial Ig domain
MTNRVRGLFAATAALTAALGTGPNSATVWGLSPTVPTVHAESSPLAIRITSPLGRTSTTGAIRIVAQVNPASDAPVAAVRFFVDNVLLGETRKGPPWGIDWTDENPFEAREIRAEALDASGHTAVDSVRLKPLELIEHAQVSSVYVETSVQDKTGRFVTGIGPSGFQLFEDDVPQTLDVVRPEQLPATFTILIDTSQSMARRIDFVRDAASRMASYMREKDRIIVAPFAKKLQTITGPTDDRTTWRRQPSSFRRSKEDTQSSC